MRRCEGRSVLTDFAWEGKLGAGAFGMVSKCRNIHTNSIRAIKLVMPPNGLEGTEFKEAVAETTLQQKLAASQDMCKIYSWGTFAGACADTLLSLARRHRPLDDRSVPPHSLSLQTSSSTS